MVPFWRSISRCFLFSSWHEKGILYGCLSSFPPQFPRYLGIWYLIFFFWTVDSYFAWDLGWQDFLSRAGKKQNIHVTLE